MVKHVVEAKSTEAQVNQQCSQVGQHPQADYLTRSPVLGPRGRVNIRSADVIVSNVQHMIHGTVCEESEMYCLILILNAGLLPVTEYFYNVGIATFTLVKYLNTSSTTNGLFLILLQPVYGGHFTSYVGLCFKYRMTSFCLTQMFDSRITSHAL